MAVRIAATLGVLVLATMAAPAVQAADDGWSFEVAVGQATFIDISKSELDQNPTAVVSDISLDIEILNSTLQRNDRSYALITSYRFNRNFAMETGYFRLGAFQYGVTGTAGGQSQVPARFELGFRSKGVTLGVSTSWPLGEVLEVRGRAGLSTSDTRVKYVATIQSTSFDDSWTASSQDFYIGAGIGVYVRKYYRIGLDMMLHRNMGKPNLTYYDSDVSNLMLSFSFLY